VLPMQVAMPVVEAALRHLKDAKARGRGDQDWSALATVVRELVDEPRSARSSLEGKPRSRRSSLEDGDCRR
jgi:hypothetical protein